jgi:hypothetical protein
MDDGSSNGGVARFAALAIYLGGLIALIALGFFFREGN